MKLSAILAPLIAAKVSHEVIMQTVQAWEAAQAEAVDEGKEKARERWRRWKAKQPPANVSKRLPTLANDSRGGARVEDITSNLEITGQTENKNISPEADKSAPDAVIGLPTVSEGDFPVSQADIDGWAEAFPGVDVRQQLAAMRQWLLANPTRRKTKRGMRKFVVSWLDRRQNAAPPPAQRSTAPPQRSIDDALDDIVNGKSHVPFTGPTIDASDNRPDWRGAENLVPFHALSAGRRSG